MKYKWCLSALALLVLSCGGRKQMSPEELEHKLDKKKNKFNIKQVIINILI